MMPERDATDRCPAATRLSLNKDPDRLGPPQLDVDLLVAADTVQCAGAQIESQNETSPISPARS